MLTAVEESGDKSPHSKFALCSLRLRAILRFESLGTLASIKDIRTRIWSGNNSQSHERSAILISD